METEQNSDKENKPTREITDTEYERLKVESERLRQTEKNLKITQRSLIQTSRTLKENVEALEKEKRKKEELENKVTTLYLKATTDALTKIHNKDYFNNALEKEVSKAKRYDRPLSLIVFDINYFKQVNDDPDLGHPGGDYILRGLAQSVKDRVRDSDTFARIGGDEFALILPETNEEQAYIKAEVIRDLVEQHFFIYNNKKIKITITLGVKQYSGETAQEFYEETDKAYYAGDKNTSVKYSEYRKEWMSKLFDQKKKNEEDFGDF